MRIVEPLEKLRYLEKYMNLFIDSYPKKPKPFDDWLKTTIVKEELQILKEKCKYCNRKFTVYDGMILRESGKERRNEVIRTLDHVIALSLGGQNRKQNRVYCCYECNQWKADKTLKRFLHEVKKVSSDKMKIHFPYTKEMLHHMIITLEKMICDLESKKIKTYIKNGKRYYSFE